MTDEPGAGMAADIGEQPAAYARLLDEGVRPIAEGDTLVILESMKMEIPVVAESDGVVKELAVNEGDVVQDGDLIAVVE